MENQEGQVVVARFTDEMIAALLSEEKVLPIGVDITTLLKRSNKQRSMDFLGVKGDKFRVFVRQNEIQPADFSAILTYIPLQSNTEFRLRRYNGKSHEHTNRIEKRTFFDFHIHTATARYQDLGGCEDGFAQPTDRFHDVEGALQCLFIDCAFVLDPKTLTDVLIKEPFQ